MASTGGQLAPRRLRLGRGNIAGSVEAEVRVIAQSESAISLIVGPDAPRFAPLLTRIRLRNTDSESLQRSPSGRLPANTPARTRRPARPGAPPIFLRACRDLVTSQPDYGGRRPHPAHPCPGRPRRCRCWSCRRRQPSELRRRRPLPAIWGYPALHAAAGLAKGRGWPASPAISAGGSLGPLRRAGGGSGSQNPRRRQRGRRISAFARAPGPETGSGHGGTGARLRPSLWRSDSFLSESRGPSALPP